MSGREEMGSGRKGEERGRDFLMLNKHLTDSTLRSLPALSMGSDSK